MADFLLQEIQVDGFVKVSILDAFVTKSVSNDENSGQSQAFGAMTASVTRTWPVLNSARTLYWDVIPYAAGGMEDAFLTVRTKMCKTSRQKWDYTRFFTKHVA